MPASPATMHPAVRLVRGTGPVRGPGKHVLQEENSRTALTVTACNKEAAKVPQFVAAFTATLGALCAGTFFAWTSSVSGLLPGVDPKGETFSWIGACLPLGCFAGCLFAGAAANRLGRQRSLLLLSRPMLLSWVLLSLTESVACMVLGRLLGGLAVGAVSVIGGMYVSEIAEPSVRGTLGSFFQLQVTVGILAGYVVGLLHNPTYLANVDMVLPVVYDMLFWYMPESPVFLVSRGQVDQAREALQWLRGPDYDVSDEVAAIRHSLRESQQSQASVRSLLSSRAAVRGMVVALGLMTAQQLSGINAVIFYTAEIFKDSGSALSGEQCSIILGIVQVVSTFVSMVLADRAGRRVLLLLSSSVMAACLATLGVFFYLKEAQRDMEHVTWLPLVAVAVFIVMFSLGLGPLPWCIVSEVFSPGVKGAASSVACAFNWLLAFTVTKFFSNVTAVLGTAGAFFVFSACTVVGTIFIAFMVPETKGKTLDQILASLTGDTHSSYAVNIPPPIEEDDDDDEEANKRSAFPL